MVLKNRVFNLKKKKPLKGMTLLEVIIAMLIMVILASILIESCVCIIGNIRVAKNVNHKVNVQTHDVEYRSVKEAAYNENDVINLKYGDKEGSIKVDRYKASDIPEDDKEHIKGVMDADNLKYFKLAKS